ncbi:MAG TPA: GNAT family N-acetyltransferase [Ilumatobacteraceae bacterium]
MPELRVIELTAEQTHPLRRRVLRDGTPSDEVRFEGDDLATTLHLGVVAGDEIVAISTWRPKPYPDRPAQAGVQLRGMASAPEVRGSGAATLLLRAGLDRAAAEGAELVWARARDTALGFYAANGFATVGRGYVDLTTGLPHHDIVLHLTH